jgi:eukaryotic-like serine/threonine-protein kinase
MQMTPERYRQIGEVYHAALEVGADERAAFLDRACAGDAALQREVVSLIASHERAPDFIAVPALAAAAELLAERETDALAGRTVARYKVLSLLGAGGMGRVYLAEDTELGRRVALKFLPEYFTTNKDKVRRFRQEACAASALNHPNILTVYEVGEADGAAFIAMEYVEGETLRSRLAGGPFGVGEALDVAAQIADALSAAHRAGIVHRDVKPENVMLRRDGYVKVLDFGLAKLTGHMPGSWPADSEAAARQVVMTNPGVVMGTAEYMSPEQARGLEVDGRTDVWSLGVVLYEMVAGRRPFAGETHGDTIVLILAREAPPLRHLAPAAPLELEQIVQKALAKDAEERYQTAKEMTIDLKQLKKRLEVEGEIGRRAPPGDSGDAASTGGQAVAASAPGRGGTQTGGAQAAAPTSSLEYAVTEISRHKAGVALAGLLLLAVLAGGGYGLYRLLGLNETKPAAPFEAMKITRLTSDGAAIEAAISPDGRHVAYVLRDGGRETLRVRQVATSSDLQIVPPAEATYIGLTFSPDGDYLYYITRQGRSILQFGSNSTGTLYQVPVLGGASRRLVTGVDSPVTFSPDGGKIAFVRAYPERGETALMVANADGSGEQRLAARPLPDVYLSKGRYDGGPAWSPDGTVIACGVGHFDEQHVVAVSAADGSESPLGSGSWKGIGRLSWLPDGSGLVIVAVDQRRAAQLWQLSYPAGESRRITNDLNSYTGVSIDARAHSLAAVLTDPRTQTLWLVDPSEGSARAKKITSANGNSEIVSWTPDNRMVFTTIMDDRWNLWVVNPDGTGKKQLTNFTNNINVRPRVSPDGRYIVFVSDMGGPRNIWRVDIDGGNPVRLTSGEIDTWPTCSPDGRWVVYLSFVTGKSSLLKVPVEGGGQVQLASAENFMAPSVSPDGSLVAYATRNERAGSPVKIVVIPFVGGNPVKTFELPLTANFDVPVRWTPDGRALAYVEMRDGASNVWSQPLSGGAPRQITDFKSEGIYAFDWSRDGKQLALWRGMITRNVVLISEFR